MLLQLFSQKPGEAPVYYRINTMIHMRWEHRNFLWPCVWKNQLSSAEALLDSIENKELISSSKNAEIYRRDARVFLQDPSFKSFMVLIKYNLKYLIPLTEEVRDQGEAIVAQIQQELKR